MGHFESLWSLGKLLHRCSPWQKHRHNRPRFCRDKAHVRTPPLFKPSCNQKKSPLSQFQTASNALQLSNNIENSPSTFAASTRSLWTKSNDFYFTRVNAATSNKCANVKQNYVMNTADEIRTRNSVLGDWKRREGFLNKFRELRRNSRMR